MVPWYRPSNLAAHEHRHWTVPCPWRSDVFGNGGRVNGPSVYPSDAVTQLMKTKSLVGLHVPGSHAVSSTPPLKSPRLNSLTVAARGDQLIMPWSFNLSLLHHRHSFRAPTVFVFKHKTKNHSIDNSIEFLARNKALRLYEYFTMTIDDYSKKMIWKSLQTIWENNFAGYFILLF